MSTEHDSISPDQPLSPNERKLLDLVRKHPQLRDCLENFLEEFGTDPDCPHPTIDEMESSLVERGRALTRLFLELNANQHQEQLTQQALREQSAKIDRKKKSSSAQRSEKSASKKPSCD